MFLWVVVTATKLLWKVVSLPASYSFNRAASELGPGAQELGTTVCLQQPRAQNCELGRFWGACDKASLSLARSPGGVLWTVLRGTCRRWDEGSAALLCPRADVFPAERQPS